MAKAPFTRNELACLIMRNIEGNHPNDWERYGYELVSVYDNIIRVDMAEIADRILDEFKGDK